MSDLEPPGMPTNRTAPNVFRADLGNILQGISVLSRVSVCLGGMILTFYAAKEQFFYDITNLTQFAIMIFVAFVFSLFWLLFLVVGSYIMLFPFWLLVEILKRPLGMLANRFPDFKHGIFLKQEIFAWPSVIMSAIVFGALFVRLYVHSSSDSVELLYWMFLSGFCIVRVLGTQYVDNKVQEDIDNKVHENIDNKVHENIDNKVHENIDNKVHENIDNKVHETVRRPPHWGRNTIIAIVVVPLTFLFIIPRAGNRLLDLSMTTLRFRSKSNTLIEISELAYTKIATTARYAGIRTETCELAGGWRVLKQATVVWHGFGETSFLRLVDASNPAASILIPVPSTDVDLIVADPVPHPSCPSSKEGGALPNTPPVKE